jgi:hypothetical protein
MSKVEGNLALVSDVVLDEPVTATTTWYVDPGDVQKMLSFKLFMSERVFTAILSSAVSADARRLTN